MTVQCLYQNDPKDAAAVLGQRNARRAANKLGWLIQQERICDASEERRCCFALMYRNCSVMWSRGGFRCWWLPRRKSCNARRANGKACWLFCKRAAFAPLPPSAAAGSNPAAAAGRPCQGRIGRDCTNRLVLLRYLRKTAKTSVSILICAGPWKR